MWENGPISHRYETAIAPTAAAAIRRAARRSTDPDMARNTSAPVAATAVAAHHQSITRFDSHGDVMSARQTNSVRVAWRCLLGR